MILKDLVTEFMTSAASWIPSRVTKQNHIKFSPGLKANLSCH